MVLSSLSIKTYQMDHAVRAMVALLSFTGVVWAIIQYIRGHVVSGWASMTVIICFISGVQLICLGVIGEYVGKIYMETKHRPRYIISDRTEDHS